MGRGVPVMAARRDPALGAPRALFARPPAEYYYLDLRSPSGVFDETPVAHWWTSCSSRGTTTIASRRCRPEPGRSSTLRSGLAVLHVPGREQARIPDWLELRTGVAD